MNVSGPSIIKLIINRPISSAFAETDSNFFPPQLLALSLTPKTPSDISMYSKRQRVGWGWLGGGVGERKEECVKRERAGGVTLHGARIRKEQ